MIPLHFQGMWRWEIHFLMSVKWTACLLKYWTRGSQSNQNGFSTRGGSVFIAVIFHQVHKMNIYESRKVMPDSEMHSAGRQSDSWPMPEEPGRQTNKSGLWGCDWVTKDQLCAVNISHYVNVSSAFAIHVCVSPFTGTGSRWYWRSSPRV